MYWQLTFINITERSSYLFYKFSYLGLESFSNTFLCSLLNSATILNFLVRSDSPASYISIYPPVVCTIVSILLNSLFNYFIFKYLIISEDMQKLADSLSHRAMYLKPLLLSTITRQITDDSWMFCHYLLAYCGVVFTLTFFLSVELICSVFSHGTAQTSFEVAQHLLLS